VATRFQGPLSERGWFLLFVVALAGVLLDPTAISRLVDAAADVAPAAAVELLRTRLRALEAAPNGGLLTVGLLGALWAASSAVASLAQALNRCYDVHETRPFWKTRGLAILVTIGAGVLTVLAAVVIFAIPPLIAPLPSWLRRIIAIARFPVAGLAVMVVWATLYWILPNVRPRFQLISPGAVVGVLLWLLASMGFSFYVSHFGKYEAIYGALGGIIILLVWMWLSSVVVLLGAEINKILTPERALKRESETGEERAAPGHRGAPPRGEPTPA
jgi:membrane protein